MSVLRIAWLSFLRRGSGLFAAIAPTVVLFTLITLLIALETTTYNYTRADRAIDSRMIRVTSVIEPFNGAIRSQLERLPHVAALSPVIGMQCKTMSTPPVRFPCMSQTRANFAFYDRQFHVPDDKADAWMREKDGVIVGADLAEAQHWQQGSRITISINGETHEVPIVYVATKGEKIDTMWVHAEFAEQTKKSAAGKYSAFWLVVDAPENRVGVIDAVEKGLATLPNPPDIQTAETAKAQLLGVSTLLIAVLRAAGLLAVVIVVLTTVISMILTIERRRRELATLRAIGCRRLQLASIIVAEAVLVGLPGVVLGAAITFAYSTSQGRISLSRFLTLRVTLTDALTALIFGLLLYIILAVLPARRAANANILAALRGD